MFRFLHKYSGMITLLMLSLVLTACAGESANPAVSSETTSEASAETSATTAASSVDTGIPDTSETEASDSSEASSSSDTASSEDEYQMPEYVTYALLKSTAFPEYRELDLEGKEADQTDAGITQIDFLLSPINASSMDSDSALKDNGLVTVNTKELQPVSNNVPAVYEDVIAEINFAAKETRDRYEIALSKMQSRRNKSTYYRYGETLELLPCRVDSRVLSVVQIRRITAEGDGTKILGKNPALSYKSIVIDGESGKALSLSDVVDNTDELALLASELLYQTYVTDVPYANAASLFTEKELQAAVSKLMKEDQKEEALFAWSPSYLGLRLFFAASALCDEKALKDYREHVSGSKDLDTFEIILPYRYAPSLFRSEYTALPSEFMAKLQPGAAYAFDFGNGDVSFRLSLPMEEDSMKNAVFTNQYRICMEKLDMDVNTVSNAQSSTTGADFYLVRYQGETYLYIQQASTETYGVKLQVFRYKEYDSVCFFELVGVSDDMLDPYGAPPLNPAHFRSRRKANILPDPRYSRLSSLYRTVSVSANGLPDSDDTYFDVEGDFVRTTSIDLNLEVLIDFEKELTETRLFPAGTTLTMFRAQLVPYTQADFFTEDGEVVRLHVNGVDAIDNVDGHMVEEAFK